jgi:Fe-S oxidoreductase
MPAWDPRPLRDTASRSAGKAGTAGEAVLLADCFNRWFEADNTRAAMAVLAAGGYTVHLARPADGGRPLCCGRTFLSAGLVEEARTEQRRVLAAVGPFVERGVPVVGLEPSCLLTLRDELRSILPGAAADAVAANALLFEEFLDRERTAGRLALPLKPLTYRRALLHGHCHQKAFATMGAVERVLSMVPELTVSTIAGTCCGMAGAFGYQPEHYAVSMAVAERDVLPAVRAAENDTLVVADRTSCRHQIGHGAGREALHVAAVLAQALAPAHV